MTSRPRYGSRGDSKPPRWCRARPLRPSPPKCRRACDSGPQQEWTVVTPYILRDGVWRSYTPHPTVVYAIVPGLNRMSELMRAQDGANFEIERQPSWDESYDHYQFRNRHGRNLRTMAALVMQDLFTMIDAGNGPAAIVCGSRGGQETMVELSRSWRGLVFDFNGGYLTACEREFNQVPDGVQLVSVLGRLDFFHFRSRGTPRDASAFEALRRKKVDFLSRSVDRRGRGRHILYASEVIDHSLADLDGRNLILSVMQGRSSVEMRPEDHLVKIEAR